MFTINISLMLMAWMTDRHYLELGFVLELIYIWRQSRMFPGSNQIFFLTCYIRKYQAWLTASSKSMACFVLILRLHEYNCMSWSFFKEINVAIYVDILPSFPMDVELNIIWVAHVPSTFCAWKLDWRMFNIFLRQYVGSRSFETVVLKRRWLNESSIYL